MKDKNLKRLFRMEDVQMSVLASKTNNIMTPTK